ncbi:MAG: aspartate dehydrogenase [Rhizobiaceae bacterium]|nr:aspartate dehydrogenase [Rhizobiaceae bacterium]
MTRQINIALVGHGAIAGYVVDRILPVYGINIAALVCREESFEQARRFADNRFPVFTSIEKLDPAPGLLVDCAGHSGLQCHAPAALENGIDVISISTGALADVSLAEKLEDCAKRGNSRIRFLSGAVGGIDALTAASVGEIDRVVYTGRKPPAGWQGSPAEDHFDLETLSEAKVHFEGTAREAARLYPKNANVAATLALASIGLDAVQVRLIADPSVERNTHEIEAVGDFGRLSVVIEGNPLPGNPKSSGLAAMSIVGALKQYLNRLAF